MSKNNRLRKVNLENRNYKLYKAKKQWVTACATFMLAFGATAVMNVSAQADANVENGTPENVAASPATTTTIDSDNASDSRNLVNSDNQDVKGETSLPQSTAANSNTASVTTVNNAKAKESLAGKQDSAATPTNSDTQALAIPAQQPTPFSSGSALAESKVTTENVAPIPYTLDGTEPPYVIAGSNLTDLASKFISNADVLAENGATFSWVGDVPTPTQEDASAGSTISGTIKVTYADGTSVEVPIESMVEPQSQLQPNTFYYVNKVGDTPDFNTADANGNDLSTILYNQNVGNPSAFSYKVVGTVDTSEIGIHWVNAQVTDNNTFNGMPGGTKVIGGPYIVQIPYVVQGLKLRDDIPVDASGNPIINAQLATMPQSTTATPTTPELAFDPTSNSFQGLWGQYFYQDYALAYALGITASASNWTAPTDLVNTKTNHFTMTFSKMPNATQQEVAVNYIASPKARDVYIYNAANRNYMTANGLNKTEIRKLFTEGYLNDKVWVTLANGTKVYASKLSFIDNGQRFIVTNTRSGKYNINFNASFDQTSSNGQPLIFSNNNFDAASTEFNSELNKWYQKTNNTNVANYTAGTPATWESVSTTGISLAPSMKAKEDPYVQELTNGPFTFDNDALEELVRNPINPTEVHNMLPTWPTNMQPNTILGDNKTWPEGTKANWLGNDGSTKLTFDKAGEKKTGDVTITLPSGSSYTVKDITVISKANVMVKNETVDYGTTLTAADLVTNKNVFPEGTTYQFVNNSEPNWEKADAYNNVQITATYKDASGASVTTPVATCAVAINDTRSIMVLTGSDAPSIDSILNLPSTWKEYTASWTTPINTNSTNQGVITIHYPAGDLDQTIKVYVSVIPKQTAVDGQNFFTNGNLYNGQTGSIANGTTTSTVLTSNGTKEVSYSAYNKSGNPGQQTTFTQGTDSYQPSYIISGVQTNADGLVSGPQTAAIRVTVPANTIGAKYDADGKYYYYELNANVNVAQKVTFEFVDQYKNNAVVGQTYSQEFIPGVATNLNFNMAMPDGYELGNGASIPSQYTLAAFSQTTPVVKVPIHQKMHFYITFHDEDSNTNLGTVEVSGSTAGNGGYDPYVVSQLKFPDGANATNYQSISTSGVPEGVTLFGDGWKSLTDPKTNWWIPNYRWEKTEAVEKALTGATMTINLKHRINTTQERQTRTATVNYVKAQVNADGTYTQDGSAAQSAVLEVYYSRNKYQDQVTKVITYSPWLWDTNQGQNGYHVVSGKWTSLPTEWGAVVADVPTVDGYTAAVITDKSGKPANQFVYPTWNTAGAGGNTDPAQASQAYTKNATAYEAQPVHTVLYIPVQTQARLVTAKFIISGGNKDGQDFAPASQVQIFYNRTGSLNVNNNTITYGNWQWDNTAGNSTTPGFKVLSGSWNLPTESTQSWSVNAPSAGSDYVMANINSAGSYSTFTFGAPSYNSNTTFTNSTANQWFMRNELTTYYVPKSLVNKTVTRTIVITEPGEATRTFPTETVVLNRQVKVNNDDTGVVFAGFAGSGWNTGTWAAQNVPTHEGYTMSATQTVNGVTTPLALVNGQVPAETVTGTTQNTTINITWGAVATATLTGNGESIYNGQAITNSELNNGIHVTVTGPTASSGTYTLQNGDVEFSTDGTTWSTNMPINAGKYQVRLTTQGENGIKNQFGNNSIVWTSDGKSTITSNATYTINKLDSAATMANAQTGNYEMTYNGAAPSAIDPAKFQFTAIVNGKNVVLDATGLTSNDFDWVDGTAPVNVGTYQVKLNAAGLAQLQQNNSNFTLTNAGNGTFTINQANASATLSGNGTRPYNGNAVSVDDLNVSNDNNTITLTLHYPKDGNADYSTTVKLNVNDFTWNTPNGQAPVNASSQAYTISINPEAVQKIIEKAVGTGQNGVSNVKFANGAITSTASYTITPLNTDAILANISEGNYTKGYNAETTNQIDPAKFQVTVMVDGKKVTLNTQSFTGNSYEWVDANGNALTENPKNVGTYYVKLTKDAFDTLQAQNPNFKLVNTGLGIYTITPAEASGTLSGSNSKVYDGQAISNDQLNSNGEIKVSLNFPGVNGQTYTLKQGDYTISGNATDVGNYTVTLTEAGITRKLHQITSW